MVNHTWSVAECFAVAPFYYNSKRTPLRVTNHSSPSGEPIACAVRPSRIVGLGLSHATAFSTHRCLRTQQATSMGPLRTSSGAALLPRVVLYVLRRCGCARRDLSWSIQGRANRLVLRLAWNFKRQDRAGRPIRRETQPSGSAPSEHAPRSKGQTRRREAATSPMAARIVYSEPPETNRVPPTPTSPRVMSHSTNTSCCPTIAPKPHRRLPQDHTQQNVMRPQPPPPPPPQPRPRSVFQERVTPRRLPTTPNVYTEGPSGRLTDVPDVEAYRQALLRRGWVDQHDHERPLPEASRSKSTPIDEKELTYFAKKSTFIWWKAGGDATWFKRLRCAKE